MKIVRREKSLIFEKKIFFSLANKDNAILEPLSLFWSLTIITQSGIAHGKGGGRMK